MVVVMATPKEKQRRVTASLRDRLVERVDREAARLAVTRSDAFEQALELWLRKLEELEEEKYFEQAAAEMNADAKDWNALTGQNFNKSKK